MHHSPTWALGLGRWILGICCGQFPCCSIAEPWLRANNRSSDASNIVITGKSSSSDF
jgi:hypothetical protein